MSPISLGTEARAHDDHRVRSRLKRWRMVRQLTDWEYGMQLGEVRFAEGPIIINDGRPVTRVHVRNTSSRTVRVSSHFHFYEVNHRLVFDRERTYGLHLDIPAGGSVRFAPDDEQEVALVPYAGERVIQGFNGLAAVRLTGE